MAKNVKTKRSMDRISNLPDAVLCHILSLLPTKQAVGSSILSTRWKFLFASVTNLDFVYSHTQMGDNEKEKPVRHISSFINFVDRVLFFHNASCIDRFQLICKEDIDSSRVNAWVSAALWRKVQELHLCVFRKESSMLPRDLFTCKTLVVLKLGIEFVLNVPAKVCSPSLKILRLDSIIFDDNGSIERLFSSCLVLEDLVIEGSCEWQYIHKFYISNNTLKRLTINCSIRNDFSTEFCAYEIVVNAPSLIYLKYSDFVADGYSLTNLYSLVEAHIDFGLGSEQRINVDSYEVSVTRFLEGISNVRSLYLSTDAMEVFQSCCDPVPVFHNLTHLEIDAHKDTLALGLPYLLESSPNLEALVIKVPTDVSLDESPYSWEPPQDVPTCFLFNLKEIKILPFKGGEEEIKMVKYCLKNAKVLKKLALYTTVDEEEELKITKKLLKFPRGSEACKLEFSDIFFFSLFVKVSILIYIELA